jgi:hypothetical protein
MLESFDAPLCAKAATLVEPVTTRKIARRSPTSIALHMVRPAISFLGAFYAVMPNPGFADPEALLRLKTIGCAYQPFAKNDLNILRLAPKTKP